MRPKGIQDVISSKEYSSTQRGSRGAIRVRGLRDVLLGQKMTDRSIPATHAQRLSEISWIDREVDRLEREANIVGANLDRIQNRLAEIADYRESLLVIVREGLKVGPEQDSEADSGPVSNGNRSQQEERDFEIVSIKY